MRQYVRGILIFLSAVASVCLGLVLALFFIVTPSNITERVSSVLRDQFGIEWTPSGEVTLKRLPSLEIVLPKAHFTIPPHPSIEADFEQASLVLDPLSYFAQTPKIRRLTINGLTVTSTEDLSFAGLRQSTHYWGGYPIDEIVLTRVSLKSGTEHPTQFTIPELKSTREKFAHFILNAQVEIAGVESQGDLTIKSNFTWPDDQAFSAITLENVALSYQGTLLKEPWNMAINIAQISDIANVEPKISVLSGSGTSPWGQFQGSASQLQIGESHYTLSGLQANATLSAELFPVTLRGETQLTWTSAGDVQLKDLRFDVTNKESRQPVGYISGNVDWHPQSKHGVFVLEGNLMNSPVAVNLSILPQENHLPLLDGQVKLNELPALSQRLAESLFNFVGAVEGKVALTAGESTAGSSLSTILHFTEKNVKTENLQFNLPVGSFSGDFILDNAGFWQGKLEGKNVQLAKLITPSPIESLASLCATGHGNLHSLSKQNWQSELLLQRGCLAGVDFSRALEILQKERPDHFPRDAFAPSLMSCFKEGRIVAEPTSAGWSIPVFLLNAENWTLTGFGHLQGQQLKLKNTFITKEDSFTPTIRLSADLSMNAGGAPLWSPNWDDALTQARIIYPEPEWSFSRFISQIERTLMNWYEGTLSYLEET